MTFNQHTNNQTLLCGVPPMEGNQKKIQDPERYKNANWMRLLSEGMTFLKEIGVLEDI